VSIISVPSFIVSSISTVSPRVFHIFTDFLSIPVPVYIDISHSHSAIIDTASIGSVRVSSHGVVFFGEKLISALFPIYDCHSEIEIRIVERRFAFATVESALMVPVSIFHSTSTETSCHTVKFDTRLGSISMII
jgi:L-ascorbate metabolism protein UlaG (beta-lactamase superfamily)